MKVTAKKKLFKRRSTKNGEQGLSLQNQPLLSQPFATTGANRARNPVTTGVTKRAAVVMVGFTVATFTSIYFLHPWSDYSASATGTVNTTLNSTTYSISLSSSDTIDTTLNAGQLGAFASNTDTLTINANTPSGYKVYISMTGNDNSLRNSASASEAIAATAGSPMQPVSLENNQWGWATTKSAINNFDNSYVNPTIDSHYAGVPTYNNEHLLTTSNTTATDVQLPVYYGFYANNALSSGTYTGVIQYSAVANAAPDDSDIATATDVASLDGGPVTFTTSLMSGLDPGGATITINDGNSEITCTNPTTAISSSTDTVTVTCTAPAMTRPGEYRATVHLIKYNKTYITTVKYAPHLGFTDKDGNIITTLQDMTTNFCTNVTTPLDPSETTSWGDIVYGTLIDSRDQNEYLVGKLADGNCWMLQNLRLDLDSSTALTPDKTNITSDWTPSTSIQKDSTRVQWTPDCNEDGSITVDDIPCAADTARSYKVGSGILGDTQTTNTNYGNYYSWSAATAGTLNTSAGAGEATGDICPKGWRLPTNAGDKSWHNLLFTTYGLTDNSSASNAKALAAPFYLLYSGNYNWSDSRVYNQRSVGSWWSSTASSASDARYLIMSTPPRLIPQNLNDRTYGFSVRCVAQ